MAVFFFTLLVLLSTVASTAKESILRRKWHDRVVQGEVALDMLRNQRSNCGKREALYTMEQIGMGSNLHQWSLALCRTMKHGLALVTSSETTWIWEDQTICTEDELNSPLSCYFKDVGCKYTSPSSIVREFNPHIRKQVPRCSYSDSEVYDGATELLFSSLSDKVITHAEEAALKVFPGLSEVPFQNMVSVHIRWGDKGKEMQLVPIEDYVKAVKELASKHSVLDESTLNVFLSTEDPVALKSFKQAAPSYWRIYVYEPAVSPDSQVHEVRSDAIKNKGSTGRYALVSLLLFLEADYFVLTTGSNWSRLINEIRRTILDIDCNGCTDMIDLQDGRHADAPRPKQGYNRPDNDFDRSIETSHRRLIEENKPLKTVNNEKGKSHNHQRKQNTDDPRSSKFAKKKKRNIMNETRRSLKLNPAQNNHIKVIDWSNHHHNNTYHRERSSKLSCECEFVKYSPCSLESKWQENIVQWQSDDDPEVSICDYISDQEKFDWINQTMALGKDVTLMNVITSTPEPPFKVWNNIMSVFTYKRHTTQGIQEYVHVPIEPTAGIMRDPRKCLSQMTELYTQSKDYLTPLSLNSAPCAAGMGCQQRHSPERRKSQFFLFDAGATLPAIQQSGTNSDWNWSGTGVLFEWYKQRGIKFDQVYAWEPAKRVSFDGVSPSLYPTLHYYPHGVSSVVGNIRNPLTIIKALCKPEDIVVFKLDIDSPKLEQEIMEQLLSDPELLDLVDDFYYEMHVCSKVMRMHDLACGGPNSTKPRVSEWYKVATPARKHGLRMHFWP